MRKILIKLIEKTGVPEIRVMIGEGLNDFPQITDEMLLAYYQRLSMESE